MHVYDMHHAAQRDRVDDDAAAATTPWPAASVTPSAVATSVRMPYLATEHNGGPHEVHGGWMQVYSLHQARHGMEADMCLMSHVLTTVGLYLLLTTPY